jgi:hypothetical protein
MFRHDPGNAMNPSDSLASALRALPPATPPPDLFLQIARTIRHRRSPRQRWMLPAALAAGVVLGLILIRPASPPSDATVRDPRIISSSAPIETADPMELERLRMRSQNLELWLAALSDDAPRDGRSLMAAAELEDMVGLLDIQLSVASSPSESLPLWRQRVGLLEDLATIRSEPLPLIADAGYAGTTSPTL